MFTWRNIKKNQSISSYYFKNIRDLIENKKLHQELKKNKINLYFNIHHLLSKYINKFKKKYENNKNINFIEDNQISDCLSKIDLVITDFSSIIFDIIYRRKPYIIFVPDANDPLIKKIYKKNYYNLIKNIKNLEFENKYYQLNDTINKIIFYIQNNFNLEPKLEKFYDSFKFKEDDSINKFINYLKNLI